MYPLVCESGIVSTQAGFFSVVTSIFDQQVPRWEEHIIIFIEQVCLISVPLVQLNYLTHYTVLGRLETHF
jgi:hypothetical protein